MQTDPRSASLKHNLRDVDIDGPSNQSSSASENSKDDVQMVLSSSSNKRPQVVWEEDELPFDLEIRTNATPEPNDSPLPVLVFAWHFITRVTCAVFAILNDNEQRQDTKFMVFFIATVFGLLNMLLLSVLKPRRLNNALCTFAVFSSVESCVLVILPDFLLYTMSSLIGGWLLLFVLSLDPCAKIRAYCARRVTRDNHFAYRRPQPQQCCCLLRHSYLYFRMLWFLLLSVVCEAGNVVYFWFLMETFDQEYDTRRQRIVLCCINLKLLFTTYTRHMLFERRFSYLAMCSEFVLFAITCTVIYLNAFLQITDEQYLILRYTFWTALGLEILVNFIMFVRFSAHAL